MKKVTKVRKRERKENVRESYSNLVFTICHNSISIQYILLNTLMKIFVPADKLQ